jgi:hypothetical protein
MRASMAEAGVVDGLLDHLRDDPALVGHPHALLGALLLESLKAGFAHRASPVRKSA